MSAVTRLEYLAFAYREAFAYRQKVENDPEHLIGTLHEAENLEQEALGALLTFVEQADNLGVPATTPTAVA